jgi:3-phenylpropionate/trans-cinnamate dioxygenase ferredoxin subunit
MFYKKTIHWFRIFESLEVANQLVPLNKVFPVEVGNQRICLAKTEKGFFALDEKCPHQGLPITHGGFCENGAIVCPFHRYSWNLTSGQEVERREDNITLYPVEERADGLYVGLPKKTKWF